MSGGENMFQTSVAKNTARLMFFERVKWIMDMLRTVNPKFRKGMATLCLPGPEGYEIPFYKACGIPGGSILGIERDPEVFELIKKKNWGINLYCGTLTELAFDLLPWNLDKTIDRFVLVDGEIKTILQSRKFLRFPIANIDLFSDVGSFVLSPENFATAYLSKVGVYAFTFQAKRDPLSSFVGLRYLQPLLRARPDVRDHLEKYWHLLLKRFEGNIPKANRMLLREIALAGTISRCFCSRKDSMDLGIGDIPVVSILHNTWGPSVPARHNGADQTQGKEDSPDDNRVLVNLTERIKDHVPVMKECRGMIFKDQDPVKLFPDESVFDIVELLGEGESFSDPVVPKSGLKLCDRLVYQSTNGTPMLMWIVMMAANPKEAFHDLLSDFCSQWDIDYFHVSRNGDVTRWMENASQSVSAKTLEEGLFPSTAGKPKHGTSARTKGKRRTAGKMARMSRKANRKK